MTCVEELFVIQAWVYGGLVVIVFGDWFVRVARLLYSRQGGWRAVYAGAIPTWSAYAAGLAALAAAVGFSLHWNASCGALVGLGPAGVAAAVLSVSMGLVAVARLIRGRLRAKVIAADAVSDQPSEFAGYWTDQQEPVSKSDRRWKVPKLIRRVLVEYGISAAAAVALGLVALSV